MMTKRNIWHEAICGQLAKGPLAPMQILRGLEAAGFQHGSKHPRGTLGARIVELVMLKRIERVGRAGSRPALYQLVTEAV